MNNFKIESFRQQLINLIGSVDLPVGVIRLILKDISSQINILYEDCLRKEQLQLQKQQAKVKEQQQKKQKEKNPKNQDKQIKNDPKIQDNENNTIMIDDTLVAWEQGEVD